jgi:hypothetical protein
MKNIPAFYSMLNFSNILFKVFNKKTPTFLFTE